MTQIKSMIIFGRKMKRFVNLCKLRMIVIIKAANSFVHSLSISFLRVFPASCICCRFRQCYLFLILMSVFWIGNMLMKFFDDRSNIFIVAVIFESLQGFFVMIISCAHHFGTDFLEKRKQNRNAQEHEMTPLEHL